MISILPFEPHGFPCVLGGFHVHFSTENAKVQRVKQLGQALAQGFTLG
jgi:hypothetical protein